jgi:hypothetical protein
VNEPRYCSNCKHHTMKPNTAHQQRCSKFVEEGEPIPCVVARGSEDKCGNAGTLWEAE